jgi:hypothetical protein
MLAGIAGGLVAPIICVIDKYVSASLCDAIEGEGHNNDKTNY